MFDVIKKVTNTAMSLYSAILVLYFKNRMNYTDNSATQLFHIFAMCCYFTPLLGAIIADSFLGKFL